LTLYTTSSSHEEM